MEVCSLLHIYNWHDLQRRDPWEKACKARAKQWCTKQITLVCQHTYKDAFEAITRYCDHD
jgi:hypothetical protein